jgi:hypothetical protein
VFIRIHCIPCRAILALVALAAPALANEDFPIAGTYTQNRICKGDGSDPEDTLVKITAQSIDSNVGPCTILSKKRDGNTIAANVQCQIAGGPLIGDIAFTLRADKSLEFVDRDNNYHAVLHKCPQ